MNYSPEDERKLQALVEDLREEFYARDDAQDRAKLIANVELAITDDR